MILAMDHMKNHEGKLVRFPGGFWAAIGWHAYAGPYFGTPTVQALVTRGVAEYTAWKDGRGGKFPIEVCVTDKASCR